MNTFIDQYNRTIVYKDVTDFDIKKSSRTIMPETYVDRLFRAFSDMPFSIEFVGFENSKWKGNRTNVWVLINKTTYIMKNLHSLFGVTIPTKSIPFNNHTMFSVEFEVKSKCAKEKYEVIRMFKFDGVFTRFFLECNKHDKKFTWETSYHSFINKDSGCPCCGKELAAAKIKSSELSQSNLDKLFVNLSKKSVKLITPINELKNTDDGLKSSIILECNCGKKYKRPLRQVIHGGTSGCDDCCHRDDEKVRITNEKVTEIACSIIKRDGCTIISKNGNTQYKYGDTIKYSCICGKSVKRLSRTINRCDCSLCTDCKPANINKRNIKINEMNSFLKTNLQDGITFIPITNDNFTNTHKTVVQMVCTCGEEYTQVYHKMKTRGDSLNGCRKCSSGESKNMIDIDSIIGSSQSEYRFVDCVNSRPLPFDRFVEHLNLLLEYDGIQHFQSIEFWGGLDSLQKTQSNDMIKNNYAIKNGFNFLRIAYYENHTQVVTEFLKRIEDDPNKQHIYIHGKYVNI